MEKLTTIEILGHDLITMFRFERLTRFYIKINVGIRIERKSIGFHFESLGFTFWTTYYYGQQSYRLSKIK